MRYFVKPPKAKKPRVVRVIIRHAEKEEEEEEEKVLEKVPTIIRDDAAEQGADADVVRQRQLEGALRELREVCGRYGFLNELDPVRAVLDDMQTGAKAGKGAARGRKPAAAPRKKTANKAGAPQGKRKKRS
jgi:hypothetical protein